MAIGTINNNTAAQLQAYAQEKAAAAVERTPADSKAVKSVVSSADSVQISAQAKRLFDKEQSVNTTGNGEGIEPPKTTTLGNGEGIEPPKTSAMGNGEGIEPPKT
jgi:hypothetical protein